MRTAILLLWALLAMPALAQLQGAYEGRASAEDQTPATRERALREALAQVLARVSGNAAVAADGRTAPILARAESLLRSVAYQPGEPGKLTLVANFDPAGVEAALKEARLPVWGVIAGDIESVDLRVHGVATVAAYARLLAALQELPMVRALAVTESEGGSLLLRLEVEGGAGRLAGALSVTTGLRREATEPGLLTYRLQPG
jgi:uncharacterized protein